MEFETKDNRGDLPIFIHSALDDYGLTAVEFRVYARLARRCYNEPAFESVPNMARDFEVSDRTIQRALKVLIECRLITESKRPGRTSLYTLNPQSLWQHRSQLKPTRERLFPKREPSPKGGDARDGGDTREGGVVTPQPGVVVTPETDEGNPNEGNPPKAIPLSQESGARRARRSKTKARGELSTGQQAVRLCRSLTGRQPNPEQRREIETKVTDLAVWEATLKSYALEGQPPQKVNWLLERYEAALPPPDIDLDDPHLDEQRRKIERMKREFLSRADNDGRAEAGQRRAG